MLYIDETTQNKCVIGKNDNYGQSELLSILLPAIDEKLKAHGVEIALRKKESGDVILDVQKIVKKITRRRRSKNQKLDVFSSALTN